MDNSRSICVCCGRKKYNKFMRSAYWSNAKAFYKSTWRTYPVRNSKICIEKCLPYNS